MKTVKEMSANRTLEGNTTIEIFGERAKITFASAGKGHNVKLDLDRSELENSSVALIENSPRFRELVTTLTSKLKARDAKQLETAQAAVEAAKADADSSAAV